MVLKDGKPLIAASTAWGDYQDQIVVNLLVELVSHAESFEKTIASRQVAYPGILQMPHHKNKQGEIMIPSSRPDSARYLSRLGHDVTIKNWRHRWSVIHFDPSNGNPRTWDGEKPAHLKPESLSSQ